MQTIEFNVSGQPTSMTMEEVQSMKSECMVEGQQFLSLIKDQGIRNLAEQFWFNAPDYFFVIPASSTGKYHAPWSTTIGGLFRHVAMGMYVASELAVTFGLEDWERDCTIAAMAGHDCLKYGENYDYALMDVHMFLPRSYYGNSKGGHYLQKMVVPQVWNTIMDAIERHMGNIANGEWIMRSTVGAGYGSRIKPENHVEYVVHLADYIASRGKLGMIDFFATEE